VATLEGESVTPPVTPLRTAVRSGFQVRALRVTQYVRGGQRTLTDVSLSVAAGEVLAVVGASGTGKTMLLETLAGVRAPAKGTVQYDGVDLFANRAAFRSALGYVPQDDIIHRDLPLYRTLRYAARLRLPASTTGLARRRVPTSTSRTAAGTRGAGARVARRSSMPSRPPHQSPHAAVRNRRVPWLSGRCSPGATSTC
jgi:ABC-type glutathione transport system ATPase component